MTLDELNTRLRRNHFAEWMDMRLSHAGDGEIEIVVPWREEFISNPDVRFTHGGILATLVDTAAAYAITSRVANSLRTIDMRVDYHAVAKPGVLRTTGKVIRLGRQIGTAEAYVYSEDGRLAASGRATFMLVPLAGLD